MEKKALFKRIVKYWILAEIVVSLALIIMAVPVMASGEVTIPGGASCIYPADIVRTTDGVLWTSYYNSTGIWGAFSTDEGATWSYKSVIGGTDNIGDSRSVICAGDQGQVFIQYVTKSVGGEDTCYGLKVKRFSSTGILQLTSTLESDAAYIDRIQGALICDSSGGIYSIYGTESGNYKYVSAKYAAYNSDFGSYTAVAISQNSASSRLFTVGAIIDDYDNIMVYWSGCYWSATNPDVTHLFSIKKPSGGSWGSITQITTGSSSAGTSDWRSLDIAPYGNGTFYLVQSYSGGGGSYPEVPNILEYIYTSGSWGSVIKITDEGVGRKYARLSIDQSGMQTILYYIFPGSSPFPFVYKTRTLEGVIGSETELYSNGQPYGALYASHMSDYQQPYSGTSYVFIGSGSLYYGYTPGFSLTAPVPNPDFTASTTEGQSPLNVQFNYTGTGGTPTSYYWTFGDGHMVSGSAYANPTNYYTTPGYYTVKLFAENGGGGAWENKTGYIHVQAIEGDFTGSPTSGGAPLYVNFNSTFSSDLYHIWFFGNGYYSEGWGLTDPQGTYGNVGTYTPKLWVGSFVPGDDYSGGAWTNKTNYIVVSGEAGPTADFFASPETGPAPMDVKFWDTSSGSPTHWLWWFGDGTYSEYDTDDSQYFDGGTWHTFEEPGTYHVTMTVDNAYGFDSKSLDYVVTSSASGLITINALDGTTKALIHSAHIEIGDYNQDFDGSVTLNLALGTLYYLNITAPGYYPYTDQFVLTGPMTINAAMSKIGTAPGGFSSIDFIVHDYTTGAVIPAASITLGTKGTLTDDYGFAHFVVGTGGDDQTWVVKKFGYFNEQGSVDTDTSQTVQVRLRSSSSGSGDDETGSSSDLSTDEREMVRGSLKNAAQIVPGLFGILLIMLFLAVVRRGGK